MPYERPAEVFPPGEYIKDELEARGWSQLELAEVLGRPPRLISELLAGKRTVTPETAHGLADAFGTSPQFWLNLESAYQLWKLEQPSDAVSRRARLYGKAPIKEMIKRRWIEGSNSITVLEKEVIDFFEISSLDDELVSHGRVAARKSTEYSTDTPAQVAWFSRARYLARAVNVSRFSRSSASEAIARLRPLFANDEDVRHVPRVLADHGIRFLIVAPLAGSKIDGACFWLDDQSPVVVLSLRVDTIDGFWFTLMHELAHVVRGDGIGSELPLDVELVGPGANESELPEAELEANKMAGEALVPRSELNNFILRTRPMFYKDRVEGFAMRIGVHPGIVNGQLHFHAGLDWKFNRDLHVKVRHIITKSALTDGYGMTPPLLHRKDVT